MVWSNLKRLCMLCFAHLSKTLARDGMGAWICELRLAEIAHSEAHTLHLLDLHCDGLNVMCDEARN